MSLCILYVLQTREEELRQLQQQPHLEEEEEVMEVP